MTRDTCGMLARSMTDAALALAGLLKTGKDRTKLSAARQLLRIGTKFSEMVDIEERHPDDIQLILISPTGQQFVLMNNHIDATGMAHMNVGIASGMNIGVDSSDDGMGLPLTWDTVFDPLAPRTINQPNINQPHSQRSKGTLDCACRT